MTVAILKRNAELREEAGTTAKRRRRGGLTDGSAGDGDDVTAPRRGQMTNLPHEQVGRLAERRGLSGLQDLLGVDSCASVAVPSYVYIDARPLPGYKLRQVLLSSPSFHGEPWHDHLEYSLENAPADSTVHHGQAHLLLRLSDGVNVIVVAEMETLPVVEESPLTAGGCIQLRWKMGGDAETPSSLLPVRLRLVPLTNVVRLVHILPDFADMCRRRQRLGTDPPSFGTTGECVRDMRYFLNAFIPDVDL